MAAFDLILRGAAIATLLLIAALGLRDHGRLTSMRLGAFLAVGIAAQLVETLPSFREVTGPWSWPLFALMAGNSVIFWLVACALFDDGFRLRPWHIGIWLAVVATAGINAFYPGPMRIGAAEAIDRGFDLLDIVFAALALAQAFLSWRGDLVEPRRRVRAIVVIGGATFTATHAVLRGGGPASGAADSAGLLAVAAAVAVMLLGVRAFRPAAPPKSAPSAMPEDRLLLGRLERLMQQDRLHREPRLSIADLARRMNLPEYRLRRLINQGRGERNFAAFVNSFRLAEVKAALADPAQAEVPVLTLALDAGFGSLGPFNRAFKAETGVTPTDYRQNALRDVKTAGRVSNSI